MATTTATATATATTTTTTMTTMTTTTTTMLATNKRQHKQRQRDAQTRPARSNSLQRMLELEKQCVLERRHAVRASPTSPKMQPPSSTSMLPAAARPAATHSRQYSAEQRKHFLEESVSGQLKMQQSRPAPLKISTHVVGATPRTNTTSTTASTDFKSDLPAPYSPPSTVHSKTKARPKGQAQVQVQTSTLSSSTGMLPQPNKLATGPKTVTFHEQPLTSNPSIVIAAASLAEDRNSICQSPSWEAYARRKKEKKQGKEQTDKETKANTKTKPRPSKLAHSHSASEPTLPLQQPAQTRTVKFEERPEDTTKARRASTIGIPAKQTLPSSPALDAKPPQTRRIRSSSLSSIFRSPFESHRPSLDHNSGGFIGGIKLEHQRLVAYQRALNEEAIGASGDIHPAFRKHTKRSSSPLRFLVPKTGSKEAQDRAYPPISIRTSATAQGLLPQNSDAMPEGRMSRWRAHFGLRSEPKPQKLNRSPSAERDQSLGAIFSHRNASSPALHPPPSDQMRYSPRRSAHPPLPPTPNSLVTSQSRPTSRHKNSPYLTASSKDNEMRSASFSNFQTLHNPKRINDRRKTMTTAAHAPNSSADSYSDDLRSSSMAGTPDTSRPGSERVDGFDHVAEARAQLERPHSPAFSTSGASVVDLNPVQSAAMKVLAAFPDLPPPTRPGMGRRTESVSSVQSVLVPRIKQQNGQQKEANKAKSIKASKADDSKAPALRDLIMSKDESSAAAPWPASYLEAARKAAPVKDSKTPPRSPALPPTPSAVPPVPTTIPSAPPSVKATSPPRSRKSSDSESEIQGVSIHGQGVSINGRPDSLNGGGVSINGGPASSNGRPVSINGIGPVAKMLVQCCGCKCYHDMPSNLYAAMNDPEAVMDLKDYTEFAGSISMSIKCPWCKHDMNTKCCAGYAAILHVQERLH
ncbi:unnamed protein product [Clonostachys rosea]|uniref:Uncharacterized protein n=1 Tax=Bionectria ochroleuca TaxID=29856 RepID=A0ABY6TQ90_BIOOC|nr:unnamed protein product [Clonostachys rosea]